MNDKLTTSLLTRHPRIFSNWKDFGHDFGFECGDGWFELIDTLCEQLQFWTDHNHAPQVAAEQVKEKFGALRFYAQSSISPEQLGMIEMASAMSAHICERCGQPGKKLNDGGLWLTRCKVHAPPGSRPVESEVLDA